MFHCFCVEVEQNFKHRQRCAQEVLCLDYSNMQERRNTSKYMITRRHWFLISSLWFWKWMWLTVFSTRERERKREMFQSKCHWVEIKYLGAIQNWFQQLFCRRENPFSQFTSGFVLEIAACKRELERLYIYLIFVNVCKYSK